jgi:cell division septation protein DedD
MAPPPTASIKRSWTRDGFSYSAVLPRTEALTAAGAPALRAARPQASDAPAADLPPEATGHDLAAIAMLEAPRALETLVPAPAAEAAPDPPPPPSALAPTRPAPTPRPATRVASSVPTSRAAPDALRAPKGYWVQIGAYTTKDAAAKIAEQARAWSYQTVLGPAPPPREALTRVMIGPFPQRTDAAAAQRDLQKRGFRDSFVVP